MKKAILYICICAGFVSCKSDNTRKVDSEIINNPLSANGEKEEDAPIITFESERIDFGDIIQGDKVTSIFKFTNTGNADLVLNAVTAGCGCTVARNWPKDPIAPGEKGEIEITFDSASKGGQQVKQIKVSANTFPSSTTVAIAGNVIEPKSSNAY